MQKLETNMRKDSVFKTLLKNKEYVADLINHFLYHDKKKIEANDLDEVNPVLTSLNKKGAKTERILDMAYAIKKGNDVVRIVGIENQSTVDQDMIIRILKSDALAYENQLSRKKRKEIEHVVRVSSMVMYWEEGKWSAARSLNEYLRKEGMEVEEGPDYDYELISPSELKEEEIEALDTPIKMVLECIRHSKDGKKLDEAMSKPIYQDIPDDCAEAIKAVTDIDIIIDKDNKGEGINMCLALDEIKKEQRETGRLIGKEEGREEGRLIGKEEGKFEMMKAMFVALKETNPNKTEEEIVEIIARTTKRNKEEVKIVVS
ncbi:MAG: Rpn family recombination-promoting nuclease/putative transposase [Solobacterium sp.]|nr:Rpn family recombination-promoting nuclease/putative transposase [Solobacterium sp.]